MAARAIIPGKLYHVRGMGIDIEVFARNPFAAIIIGARLAMVMQ